MRPVEIEDDLMDAITSLTCSAIVSEAALDMTGACPACKTSIDFAQVVNLIMGNIRVAKDNMPTDRKFKEWKIHVVAVLGDE